MSLFTIEKELDLIEPNGEEEYDVPVRLEFEYTAAERGSRERGTGLQMEPDYPSTAELWGAVRVDNQQSVLHLLDDKRVAILENDALISYEEGDDD